MYKISKKFNLQIALKHVEDLADSCYAHLQYKRGITKLLLIFSMQIATVVFIKNDMPSFLNMADMLGLKMNKQLSKTRQGMETETERKLSFWGVCLLFSVDTRCDCIDISWG